MLPPGAKGTVSYIAPAGHYNINEEIIEVDFMGQKKVGGAVPDRVAVCLNNPKPVHCYPLPSPRSATP